MNNCTVLLAATHLPVPAGEQEQALLHLVGLVCRQ